MNIFVFDSDPVISASMLCDKHVVKMIIEAAQMLSTAMNLNGYIGPYKSTHINHPCNIWTRTSLENYQWLWHHAMAIGNEYTKRYGKVHLTQTYLFSNLIRYNIDLPEIGLTEFANCTPYKDMNVFDAYKKYYIVDKAYFAKWRNGNVPNWFGSEVIT